MTKEKVTDVDAYINSFPSSTKKLLKQMRSIIKKAAPKATEIISYQMPAYKMKTVLVFFAGYDKHIGFYPTASGIENFKNELSKYKSSKGAIQFPLDQPLPVDLITGIVKFRVQDDEQRSIKKDNDFMTTLGAPAKRALQNEGIKTLKQLSNYTERDILKLHGMGKTSIPKLKAALNSKGLSFKE